MAVPNKNINFVKKRPYTYTVTMRRFRVTIVAVENKQVLDIMTVCVQPELSSMQNACIFIILSSVAYLYHIFVYYLINGTIFEKKNVIEQKIRVLIFSTTFV
jgi:hypothetical protein